MNLALLAVALCLATTQAAPKGGWSVNDYPNPVTESGSVACGHDGSPAFVCDPESLLDSKASLARVEDAVRRLEEVSVRHCQASDQPKGTQFAIAVMNHVRGDVEAMAKGLHDAWGVGHAQVRCEPFFSPTCSLAFSAVAATWCHVSGHAVVFF